MGNETTEMWREVREVRRAKRASNREFSMQVLKDNAIPFFSRNMGAHLIIQLKSGIDFWPSTGLWKCREGKKGRGIKKLVEYINLINQKEK